MRQSLYPGHCLLKPIGLTADKPSMSSRFQVANLTVANRQAIVCACFIVPLTITLALLLVAKQEYITFAEKELKGTAFIRNLSQLLDSAVREAHLRVKLTSGEDEAVTLGALKTNHVRLRLETQTLEAMASAMETPLKLSRSELGRPGAHQRLSLAHHRRGPAPRERRRHVLRTGRRRHQPELSRPQSDHPRGGFLQPHPRP